MRYLSLLLMGCVKTVYVERERIITDDSKVVLGMELQAWCEELKNRHENHNSIYSEEIAEETIWLRREIENLFPWGVYPSVLEDCLESLEH